MSGKLKTLTLDELDKLIAGWAEDLDNMSNNLLELAKRPGYRLVTGRGLPKRNLTGATLEHSRAVMAACDYLWEYYPRIQTAVAQAQDARKNMPRFSGRQKAIDDIQQMLEGDTIQLPSTEVPLEQRGLLGEAAKTHVTSAAKLKRGMVEAFGKATTGFALYERLWKQVGDALDSHVPDITALRKKAQEYGKGDIEELVKLADRLKELNDKVHSDPLSFASGPKYDVITDVTPMIRPFIDRAKRKLKEFEDAWKNQPEELERARALVERVRIERVEYQQLKKEALAKIKGLEDALPDPPSVRELDNELDAIEALLKEKKHGEVELRMAAWFANVPSISTRIRDLKASATTQLERRETLLGRWARSKARTREYEPKGLVVGKALQAFADKIAAALTGQCDLHEAEAALGAYETALEERISGLS